MDQGFSILMFFFSAALLFYAALMAITKDYNILPYRARVSVKPKNPKKYMVQMAKIVALVAVAVAAGAAVALWNTAVGAVVMLVSVIFVLWLSTIIIKKAEK